MKKWFNFYNNEKTNTSEIAIFSEIDNQSLNDFANEFNAIKNNEHITLFLNSQGGDVFAGIAIYNLLYSVKEKLTIEVMGYAASIASVILLAADERIIDNGSFVMIHDPFTSSAGTSEVLRKDADTLDRVKEQIVSIYTERTGLDAKAIFEMMETETWFDCSQAVENGFATNVNNKAKIAACAFGSISMGFKNVPKNLIRQQIKIEDLTIRDYEEILRDVGFSRAEATQLARDGFKTAETRDAKKPDEVSDFLKELSIRL